VAVYATNTIPSTTIVLAELDVVLSLHRVVVPHLLVDHGYSTIDPQWYTAISRRHDDRYIVGSWFDNVADVHYIHVGPEPDHVDVDVLPTDLEYGTLVHLDSFIVATTHSGLYRCYISPYYAL
jgi:hypothetical protein